MQLIIEIIISFFLIFGAFFMLVGSIGMVRLPDLFMRLHAPTKSSTLGLGEVPEALNRPLPWQRYRRVANKEDQQ